MLDALEREIGFFGGVERDTPNNCCLVPVSDRKADTLLDLILIVKYVRPG